MDKKTKIIAKLKKTQDSLDRNIDAIKQNNEASKYLVDLRQESEMLYRIVDSIPDDLIEKKGDILFEAVESEHGYVQSHIPNIPAINTSVFSTGTGLITSGCVIALDIIDYRINKADSSYLAPYNTVIQQYESFQNDQKRINKIKLMLDNISEDLSKKFIETIGLHKNYQIGLIDNATFANSLRNLIYKFQGELKDIINKKFNLSKQKFKWDSLCNYLAKNGKDSVEYKQLINMKTNYDHIKDSLSKIAKNRNNQTKNRIQILYNKTIGFIYSVLNLTNLD